MKKKLCILSLLLTLVFPASAKADQEPVQKVLTIIKRVEDESSLALQKYNSAVENVTSTYEGIQAERDALQNQVGNIKSGVTDVYDQASGVNSISDAKKLKNSKKTVLATMSNVNDLDKTRKDIQNDLISKTGAGNDTANDQSQELKMKLILGEMIADLYSNALTTRTAIASEKDEVHEMSDTQSIIMYTTAKSDSITRRYSKIWDLDTSYFQYYIMDLSKEFSADAKSEDGEVEEEKTGLEKAQEIVAERSGEDKEEKKGFNLKDAYKKAGEYKDKAGNVISDAQKLQKGATDTIDDANKAKSDMDSTLDTAHEYKDSISSGGSSRLPFGKSSSYRRQETISFAKLIREKGGANE